MTASYITISIEIIKENTVYGLSIVTPRIYLILGKSQVNANFVNY